MNKLSALKYVYRKCVTREFQWLETAPPGEKTDILYIYHIPNRPLGTGVIESTTIHLDLTQEAHVLWNDIHKNDRYKIQRAERDGILVEVETHPDPELISELGNAYREIELRKGRPPLDLSALGLLADRGQLTISRSRAPDGRRLSWHAYVTGATRARLFISVTRLLGVTTSAEKNQAGRANRYHHWRDISSFKERGFHLYDFGGYYEKGKDSEKVSIGHFKKGFGGQFVNCYSQVLPITLVGNIAWRIFTIIGMQEGNS